MSTTPAMLGAPSWALGHLNVVDLSSSVAGQYAARLLAVCGAQVVLVEQHEGSALRTAAPLVGDTSALFEHLNARKRTVRLPRDPAEARASVQGIVEAADVVIRDAEDHDYLEIGATTVECVIRDFPENGPYGDWVGSELIHQALSGYMNATGRADEKPLYGIGQRAACACGTTAAVSVLAALHERTGSGRGQVVEADVFRSMAAIGQNFVTQFNYNGTAETRARYTGLLATLECEDGWIVMFAMRDPADVCRVFDAEDLIDDPRFDRPAAFIRDWDRLVEAFAERAATMRVDDVVERAQGLRISCERIASIDDLLRSEQWREREVVRRVGEADDGGLGFEMGPIIRMAAANRPSAQGAHVSRAVAGRPEASTNPPVGPLAGIRVLDLTTAWAGPFASRSLAWLGADVIKIEPPARPDGWRGFLQGGAPHQYPDLDPGERPYNRNLMFNTQGHDKRSLVLDLKSADGKAVFRDLAASSDIVIANFTPGVLDRLGIGFDDLAALGRKVVIEMPAFGSTGPSASHQGMGKTMEAACGMAGMLGYGDALPVLTGPAILDPIGGLNATFASLVALVASTRTERSVRVEVAQTEAAAHWIGEYVLSEAAGGAKWVPRGNERPGFVVHDAYPAAGTDQWVAIAVGTEEQWRALCDLIGRADLADPDPLDSDARPPGDGIDADLTAWTMRHDKHEAAAILQCLRIPAAPVCDGADVARDPGLAACGFFVPMEHPEAGRHSYPGLGYLLGRTPGSVRRPAPLFGQHNDEILSGIAGRSAADIARLRAANIVADVPLGFAPSSRPEAGVHR